MKKSPSPENFGPKPFPRSSWAHLSRPVPPAGTKGPKLRANGRHRPTPFCRVPYSQPGQKTPLLSRFEPRAGTKRGGGVFIRGPSSPPRQPGGQVHTLRRQAAGFPPRRAVELLRRTAARALALAARRAAAPPLLSNAAPRPRLAARARIRGGGGTRALAPAASPAATVPASARTAPPPQSPPPPRPPLRRRRPAPRAALQRYVLSFFLRIFLRIFSLVFFLGFFYLGFMCSK